jgi:uncharacterized protein
MNWACPTSPSKFSTVFWDLFGEQGHPIRATVSEMGPLLLARLLDLNDVQEGVLNIAFRVADEQGLLLLDLKDLRAILTHVAENAANLTVQYGNISPQTVGTIQRQLLVLENQKGEVFFGEPALDINDLMRTDRDGRGIVNILAADKLMASPRLYATFLLWLLSELFEELPEVGDPAEAQSWSSSSTRRTCCSTTRPRRCSKRSRQVVRLIRSKGVGVYFVTQNPLDVPETVLAQLGNRVQHALRAFHPARPEGGEGRSRHLPPEPQVQDRGQPSRSLAVGEALISMLAGKGVPSIVERALMAPPMAQVGPIVTTWPCASRRWRPPANARQVRRRGRPRERL